MKPNSLAKPIVNVALLFKLIAFSVCINFEQHLYNIFSRRCQDIPITFYSSQIEWRSNKEYLELMSEASDITWKVSLKGRRIHGTVWTEFVEAHDFKVGDMLMFKNVSDLKFNVYHIAPTCGDIIHSNITVEDDDIQTESNQLPVYQVPQNQKDILGTSQRTILTDETVTLTVTKDTIASSRIGLPKSFCNRNRLYKVAGHKITVENEIGAVWLVNLVKEKNDKRMRLASGLSEFLQANNVEVSETITLKLIWQNTALPKLKLSSRSSNSCRR